MNSRHHYKIRFSLISLFLTVVFFTLSLAVPNKAYAAKYVPDTVCEPSKSLFQNLSEAFKSLDIIKTTESFFVTMATESITMAISDGSTNQVMACLRFMRDGGITDDVGNPLELPQLNAIPGLDECTYDEKFCEGMIQTYKDATVASAGGFEQVAGNRVGGSLIGIANIMESTTYEPVPVNLAYFFNRHTEKIPFMGTALAQDVTYKGPFMGLAFDLWKVIRNMAIGALAIVMIIASVMIMTRKRIGPQAAVTVQYAIPRIIISFLLIVFSYAIGAAIASFTWALRFSADNILFDAAEIGGGTLITEAGAIASLGIVAALIMMMGVTFMAGIGLVTMTIALVGFVIALILWVWLLFKMFIVYVKMLIYIVVSPAIFAYAAVPGNDAAIINWFKRMFAYMLSIFGMAIMIGVVRLMAAAVIINMLDTGGDPITGALGIGAAIIVGPMFVALIYVFGLNYARKIPDKVEAAMLGKKRR